MTTKTINRKQHICKRGNFKCLSSLFILLLSYEHEPFVVLGVRAGVYAYAKVLHFFFLGRFSLFIEVFDSRVQLIYINDIYWSSLFTPPPRSGALFCRCAPPNRTFVAGIVVVYNAGYLPICIQLNCKN